ncbi:MAG: hypothetical protein WBF53_05080 [Litorimonas sp.]
MRPVYPIRPVMTEARRVLLILPIVRATGYSFAQLYDMTGGLDQRETMRCLSGLLSACA